MVVIKGVSRTGGGMDGRACNILQAFISTAGGFTVLIVYEIGPPHQYLTQLFGMISKGICFSDTNGCC